MSRITPFGISALSKANKHVAYDDELLCNKETGEMCVHTSDKDVISYNYFTRMKMNMELVAATALFNSFYGTIYTIQPDDIDDLPSVIVNDTIATDIDIEVESKAFILGISLDVLAIQENKLCSIPLDDVYISYVATATLSDDTPVSITKSIRVQDTPTDITTFDATFKSLHISDISVTVDGADKYVAVLNNIILMI